MSNDKLRRHGSTREISTTDSRHESSLNTRKNYFKQFVETSYHQLWTEFKQKVTAHGVTHIADAKGKKLSLLTICSWSFYGLGLEPVRNIRTESGLRA